MIENLLTINFVQPPIELSGSVYEIGHGFSHGAVAMHNGEVTLYGGLRTASDLTPMNWLQGSLTRINLDTKQKRVLTGGSKFAFGGYTQIDNFLYFGAGYANNIINNDSAGPLTTTSKELRKIDLDTETAISTVVSTAPANYDNRWRTCMCNDGTNLYLTGGFYTVSSDANSTLSTKVFKYDTSATTWTQVGNVAHQLIDGNIVYHNGKIMTAGQPCRQNVSDLLPLTIEPTRDIFIYDPITNLTETVNFPFWRFNGLYIGNNSCVVDDYLFVVTGLSDLRVVIIRFNLKNMNEIPKQYRFSSDVQKGRMGSIITYNPLNEKMYVFGGTPGNLYQSQFNRIRNDTYLEFDIHQLIN